MTMITYTILQVRLEMMNHKYGEGIVAQIKKWWNGSHQNEIDENVEHGINFMRIIYFFTFLSFLLIMFLTGLIDLESGFSGFKAYVPTSQLILVLIIDLDWLVYIVWHPIARKKLVAILKCQRETIQVTKA